MVVFAFGDSVIGLALSELFRAVSEAIKKSKEYREILKSLESTLKAIAPEVDKVIKTTEASSESGKVNEFKKLSELMKKGKDLVNKCSKSKGFCSCFSSNPDYSEDLREFERNLKNFCQIELPILIRATQLEMFEEVQDIHDDVEDIGDKVNEISSDAKNIDSKVKDIHKDVTSIHKNVGETKDEIKDGVKEVHKDVKEILRKLEQDHEVHEQKRQHEAELEQKRQHEAELEQKRQHEIEQNRQREIELERKRQCELEQKRQHELEVELERKRQHELEQKRQRDLERKRQRELELEQKRQHEIEIEVKRKRQFEFELERKRQHELEVELERKRQRELELELVLERKHQYELEQKHQRELELEVDRKQQPERERIISNGTPSLRPYLPPEPPELTVGLERPLKELKKKLLKQGSSTIGLSAPGGCGKTTLAKKLCQDKDIKAKFKDNIFFISVSKTPNLKVIIQGLFLNKGFRVPEFQSDEDAINHLEQLLKQIGQNPILLVLDDVWQGSDYLIDKFINFQVSNYKVVVTSRFTIPRLDHTQKLDTLNESDSLLLFRKSACLEDNESQSIDEDLVKQVARACKGFPLALNVVGKSLCRQPSVIWKKTLNDWSKGSSIFKNNELLNCLKTSLDALDSQPRVKECYMDLGSFPEGHPIPATALIDMWVELYGMDEDGPEFIANLIELSSLNLLDIVISRKDINEDDGNYSDHFVMQHDLLKELVNHLSKMEPIEQRKRLVVEISGNEVSEWSEQNMQSIRARLISISTDEKFSSNWYNMHAPEAKVLVLNFYTESYHLPQFITSMEKLKSLIITKYGFFPAQISNFALLGALPNLKRVRLEQVLVPSLTLIFGRSKNLRNLCLHKCDISDEFGNVTSNALPNLVEINISHPNNLVALPSGLCDILSLKKLSITYSQDLSYLPKEIRKLTNLEVLRLSFCTHLLELPDTIGSLQRLCILDLSDCISLNKLPEQIGELKSLRKLYMTRCLSCKLPKSFFSLTGLKDVICDEVMAKLLDPRRGSFSNLNIKIIP